MPGPCPARPGENGPIGRRVEREQCARAEVFGQRFQRAARPVIQRVAVGIALGSLVPAVPADFEDGPDGEVPKYLEDE